MNRLLILITIFFLSIVMISCGVEDEDMGDTGNTGECTGSDKFCHSHDGLNWSDVSINSMNWDEAVTYCENLGGRLPTISELRTLIQNCSATGTGGECRLTDSCLSYDCRNDPCAGCEYSTSGKYSVFGDTSPFWSSLEPSDFTDGAWGVNYANGDVFSNLKYDFYYVRCVK